jgi:lysozyme
MAINNAGIELIQSFESWSSEPYQDPIGIWTIGYGAIWGIDGKRVTENHRPITKSEGKMLLSRDLALAERAVLRFITRQLNENEYAALVSWTFNLGSGALQRSTLRHVINRGEDDRIRTEWMRWVYAGGRKFRGLIRRREAEVSLFELSPPLYHPEPEPIPKDPKPSGSINDGGETRDGGSLSWLRRKRSYFR